MPVGQAAGERDIRLQTADLPQEKNRQERRGHGKLTTGFGRVQLGGHHLQVSVCGHGLLLAAQSTLPTPSIWPCPAGVIPHDSPIPAMRPNGRKPPPHEAAEPTACRPRCGCTFGRFVRACRWFDTDATGQALPGLREHVAKGQVTMIRSPTMPSMRG